MAFNRYMTKAPMQFSFYKEPIEVLSQALQVRQQTYDKNAALADQLLSMSVDALDQDRASANTITRGYQESVDKMAESYQGDYSRMGKELMGLARKVRKDFTAGGHAYSIEHNKGAYDKWLDFSQKAALSGKGPSVQQVNAGSQHILGTYGGVDYNASTGMFNTLQTPQLVEYQEMSELVDYFAKNVVPNKIESGAWEVSNNKLWVKGKIGIEEITKDRIELAVKEGLNSHQGWRAYEGQMAEFGQPISDEMYRSQINRATNTFAYRWTQTDQDIMVNPYALEDYKNQEAAGPDIPSRYTPARVGMDPTPAQRAVGITSAPQRFDKTEFFNLSRADQTPEANMRRLFTGGMENIKPDIQKPFSEFMNLPQTQTKYGVFGQNLYKSMASNPEFGKLSEAQKATKFANAYETARAEYGRISDTIYTLNDKSRESLTKQFLRSGHPANARYTVIDDRGNRVISGATAAEYNDIVTNLGNRTLGIKPLAEHGEVLGITNPAGGLPFGLEIGQPEASTGKQKRYRIIMEDFDARATEASKHLQQLYYPRYGITNESPWIELGNPNWNNHMARNVSEPQFNSEGVFTGTKEAILFQELEIDPNTGRPMITADGTYKTKNDPFISGFGLQDIIDEEFKATGLRHHSLKLKDDKF